MQRCLELAAMGRGMVAPNPMVGCVIVCDDLIIAEGYHQQYGGNHAEINALNQVRCPEKLSGATMYVNLEPCSHYGKTPPCTEAILKHRIPRIVIGNIDPNPQVAGQGIKKLRDAGCEVTVDVLREACCSLNKRFLTFQTKKRPYIILKWAQTSDGFIDVLRYPDMEARPTWITGEEERCLVHKWRSEESAIMAGPHTVQADNPSLNLRHFSGRDPLRIIPDRRLELSGNLNILDGESPTLIITEQQPPADRPNLRYLRVPSLDDLNNVLHELYQQQILSVFVEGGAQLLGSFLSSGLWDEARIFTGLQEFGKGVPAPKTPQGTLILEHDFPKSHLQIIGA